MKVHTWWLSLRRCTVPKSLYTRLCNFVQFGHATLSIFTLQLWVILFYNKHGREKSINLRDKYKEKYLKKPGLSYKSAYDYKLIIECCVIAFSLMPFWIQGMLLENYVIRGFAGTIIILGFLENYINIHAELFKARIEV